jgi:hypothetical protein|tara:strand:- start:38 stop:223 length:186 start_codon:yes stop_codon:yes gene_type:complete
MRTPINSAKYIKDEETNENAYIFIDHGSVGSSTVPMDLENSDYVYLLELVKEGSLTIQAAD